MMNKVLNTQKKRDYKLVGASLPSWVSIYLSIYTTAKGETKTNILKPLIENWVNKCKRKDSEDKLIREIINRINLRLNAEKTHCPELSVSLFKTNIEQELQSKGIPAKHIKNIVKKIK